MRPRHWLVIAVAWFALWVALTVAWEIDSPVALIAGGIGGCLLLCVWGQWQYDREMRR